MRKYSCDSHKCNNFCFAEDSDDLPDGWEIHRDTQSEESFVHCPDCENEWNNEIEAMRQEYIAAGSPCHMHEMNVQNYCNRCGFGLKGENREFPDF